MSLWKKAAFGLILCCLAVLGLNSPAYSQSGKNTASKAESSVKSSSSTSSKTSVSQSKKTSQTTKSTVKSSPSSKSSKSAPTSTAKANTARKAGSAQPASSTSSSSGKSGNTVKNADSSKSGGTAPPGQSLVSGEAESTQMQDGKASWFGKFHHGKTTASGEPFDMFAMTAAHRELPFGTVIRVTNNANNKVVLVRVNDRGPYRGSRVLDLSFAAADRLGMSRDGVAPVSIEVVSDSTGKLMTPGSAFFVSLDNPTSRKHKVDRQALEDQLVKLFRVGLYSEALKLSTSPQGMLLGPYDSFEGAHEALMKVYTTHPEATVTLANRRDISPANSAFAEVN